MSNGSELTDKTSEGGEGGGGKASDRRTFRGLLVKPREQAKYAFLFMGGGMLLLTLFIGVVMFSLNQTLSSIELAYGLEPDVSSAIQSSVTATLSIALMISAVLSVFSLMLGIQMSHRLYGPLIPIQRHIGELKKGNFSSRILLRKGDELMELQDSLNGLAADFESKYKLK